MSRPGSGPCRIPSSRIRGKKSPWGSAGQSPAANRKRHRASARRYRAPNPDGITPRTIARPSANRCTCRSRTTNPARRPERFHFPDDPRNRWHKKALRDAAQIVAFLSPADALAGKASASSRCPAPRGRVLRAMADKLSASCGRRRRSLRSRSASRQVGEIHSWQKRSVCLSHGRILNSLAPSRCVRRCGTPAPAEFRLESGVHNGEAEFRNHSFVFVQDASLKNAEALVRVVAHAQIHACFVKLQAVPGGGVCAQWRFPGGTRK